MTYSQITVFELLKEGKSKRIFFDKIYFGYTLAIISYLIQIDRID